MLEKKCAGVHLKYIHILLEMLTLLCSDEEVKKNTYFHPWNMGKYLPFEDLGS